MEEEFFQPEESSVDSWNTDEITSCFSARTTKPEDIYMQLWEIESVCVCLYHHSHDFHTVNPS